MTKIHPIFSQQLDDGTEVTFGVGEDQQAYWNGKPIVTEEKVVLQLWVNIALIVTAIAVVGQMVFAGLVYFDSHNSASRSDAKPSASVTREAEYVVQPSMALEAHDLDEMRGTCKKGNLKALPSGLLAMCKNSKWLVPTPHGFIGSDNVTHQEPPFCGPFAHATNDPKLGPLCIQNEGNWWNAAKSGNEVARRPTREPCPPLPGGPPGVLTSCSYSTDGKIINSSAPSTN